MAASLSVVMLGASGAVGGHVVSTLLAMPELKRLTLLGRREVALPQSAGNGALMQHVVNIEIPDTYVEFVAGHNAAVCTLGVGQPSKLTKAEFLHIDKDVVIAFATICKQSGVRHFELLGAVAADSKSRTFYLRIKGELEEALVALNFERLSLFQPSMILTPTNRYGVQQALTLTFWPMLSPLLFGPLRKFRGVGVETLGAAMAKQLLAKGSAVQRLLWDDVEALSREGRQCPPHVG